MAVILREADVQDLIEMDAVIEQVESAMRELGEGKAQNEPRRRAFAPGGVLNVMFASYPGGGCTGVKAYSVAGGKARFLVSVFGLDGALQALIEADFMGSYRTGAATAVAARAAGVRGRCTVALIGTGWQARTQALALSRVLDVGRIRAFSRDPDRRAKFAAAESEELGVEIVPAASAEEAVRGANVVVTITTSRSPVLEAGWVEPGAFVAAAGSNFHNRAEIPPDLVERAQNVIVDQLAVARLESGDLIKAQEAGRFDWQRAVELGDVVTGKWARPQAPGITLFESHGLALWDLAAATAVLRSARERGMVDEIELLA